MATRLQSVAAEVTANGTINPFNATTETIINSIAVTGASGGTHVVQVQKSGATPVGVYKVSTNDGEVLSAPIILEDGDAIKIVTTGYTSNSVFFISYAYNSESYAGQSIDILTDVDTTGKVDGDVLSYNSTTGDWEASSSAGGGVTSVNGDAGPAVVVDASDIDYTVGTTVYAKLTDHQNAIVDIQDVVKHPTDKAELQEDANNKVSIDGTTGTESITLKTDGTDALVVTDQRATVNVGLNASQGLTVNFGAGSQYTMPTTSGNANEVIVSDGSGGTSFAPAALPTASDTLEVDGIDFNLTPTATEANGRLLYDSDIESLVFLSENGNKIALGSVYLPVVNKTTSTITLGTVVKFVGAEGDRFKIEAFDASADEELHLIGVVEKDIAQDDNGVVVQVGYVKGIDTSTYTVGDILYASTTAGELTTTAPTKPDLVIPVGVVKTSASNGSVFVRPTAYHHLNEAHDVSTTAPTNEAVLAWNSTSQLWEPADNYANTTGTIFTGGIPVMTDSNSFKADTNLFVFNNAIISTYDMTVADLTVSKLNLNASGTALIDGISTGDVQIKSKGSIANILDSDANETGKQFSVEDSLGNKIMVVDEGGNVGIGTNSPSEKLHVVGNMILDGGSSNMFIGDSFTGDGITAGQNNVGIGSSVLRSSTSTTQYALAIGSQAARFGNNDHGMAIGFNAGYNGSQSSAYVGSSAGKNAAGQRNVGIGYRAGGGLSNGVQSLYGNVSVGYEAGRALETAATAVGYQALTALTTGTGNTALGYQAGNTVTTGINNTILGYSAGGTNNSYTTLIGHDANADGNYGVAIGWLTKAGNFSTSIGTLAGGNSSTATYNVFVGDSAGRFNSGDRNVIIGKNAGYNTSTASDNVFIGYNAGYSETGNHKLYIENTSSTTPLIYGEFDNDIVRVNGTLQVGDPSSTGFALPSTDGTEDQTLTTDGSGAVTWKAKAKYCQLLRSTAQTLTTNTVAWEDLLYDGETIDTWGFCNHTSGAISIASAGVYILHFSGEINNVQATNARRVIKLRMTKNGALVAGTERGTYQRSGQADGDVSIRYIYNKTDSTNEVFRIQAQIDIADTNTGNNYYFDNGVFILETLST